MVNNKCTKCGKTVYAAEEKRFEHPKDGVLYFHNMCFGIYKKEYEQSIIDHRNREYVFFTFKQIYLTFVLFNSVHI